MINVGVIAKGQKKIMHVKKIILGDPATCSCENVEYLFIDDSVVASDEIKNPSDSLSKNVPTDVTSPVSICSHNKKVRNKMDCYTLHKVLLVVILLFIIVIIKYHCIDGFIRAYNGTKYLILFGPEKYDAIYNRI